MKSSLLGNYEYLLKGLDQKNPSREYIIDQTKDDLNSILGKEKNEISNYISFDKLYTNILEFIKLNFRDSESIYELLEEFLNNPTLDIEYILSKIENGESSEKIFFSILFLNIYLQIKTHLWKKNIETKEENKKNEDLIVNLLSDYIFGEEKILNGEIKTHFREKTNVSMLRKIIVSKKHLELLTDKGMINDKYGGIIEFENIRELKDYLDFLGEKISKENFLGYLDFGVMNDDFEKGTATLSNNIPFLNIFIKTENDLPIGELGFRLSPNAQEKFINQALINNGIVKNGKILNKEAYRYNILNKGLFLNHSVYKLIQDVGVILILDKHLNHVNPLNFFQYRIKKTLFEILKEMMYYSPNFFSAYNFGEDDIYYIYTAITKILQSKLPIFKDFNLSKKFNKSLLELQ